MIEFELRIPVATWMLSRQLVPVMEMASMRNCDMVGFRFSLKNKVEYMVAVELKLRNVAAVLRQCRVHAYVASEVWAAMLPISQKNTQRFRDAGYGLLIYESGEIVESVQPRIFERDAEHLQRWQRTAWRRRSEYLGRMTRPNMTRF